MKRILSIILALCMLLSACTPNTNVTASSSSSSSSSALPVPPPNPVAIEIEHDIEYWWTNYLQDMVYLIQAPFPAVKAADQQIVLEYCATRYARDNSLVPDVRGEEIHLPKAELASYAKSLFGIGDIDSFYWDNTINSEGKFDVYCAALMRTPDTTAFDDEWYPFKLLSATKTPENTVELKLGVRALGKDEKKLFPDGYTMYRIFTMVHTGGDRYYLSTVTEEPVKAVGDTANLSYTGNYNILPLIDQKQPYALELSALDGRIINRVIGPGTISLTSVDAKTGGDVTSLYSLLPRDTIAATAGKNLVLYPYDEMNFYTADAKLSAIVKHPLPDNGKAFYEKVQIDGEPDKSYPVGYTVTSDLSKAEFRNETGIHIVDLATGKDNIVIAPLPTEKNGPEMASHFFSSDDRYLVNCRANANAKISEIALVSTDDLSVRTIVPATSINSQTTTFISMETGLAIIEQLNQPLTRGSFRVSVLDYTTGKLGKASLYNCGLNGLFTYIGGDRLILQSTDLVKGIRTHRFMVVAPITGETVDTGFTVVADKPMPVLFLAVSPQLGIVQVHDSLLSGGNSAVVSFDIPSTDKAKA